MVSKAVRRYVERHVEPAARVVADCLSGAWERCVAVPACGEGVGLHDTMDAVARCALASKTLLIVLVNAAEDGAERHHIANQQTLASLSMDPDGPPWRLLRWRGLDVVAVDHASTGRRLPTGQGVGLARRIAADIALLLWSRGQLHSEWLYTTDADARVPVDYLTRPLPEGLSAALFPFEHVGEGDAAQRRHMAQYEAYLHYYTLGLVYAGSAYGYTPMGSAIAFRFEAYAAVRGFPKRLAGEDFYLLNKLAKVGPVAHLEGAPILLRGRLSDRVPFGTGAALHSMRDDGDAPMYVYDPDSFEVLKQLLWVMDRFALTGGVAQLNADLSSFNQRWRGSLECVEGIGLLPVCDQLASQGLGAPQRRRRLREWFDAFRTLKWMHRWRDAVMPEVPIHRALERAAFVPRGDLSETHLRHMSQALMGARSGVQRLS